jgi:hypothetical protein
MAGSPWIFAERKACTKGGTDGYPNVCRTRRKNAPAGIGFGDTAQQIGNAREVETLWPAGDQRRTIQFFRRSVVARLTSNSTDELHKLVSELQKMQEFLKSEVDNVQRQIDSAVAGINIIVETIGPWKNLSGSQTLPSSTRNVRAGDRQANIEQRIRVG